MQAPPRYMERFRSVAVLLSLAGFSLYLATLGHELFADDEIYLAYKNHIIRSLPASELYRFLSERTNPWEFLPFRDLTYWLDFQLYGDEPAGFHLSNLIWYGAASLSATWLFAELSRFVLRCDRPTAFALAVCGMALFILHPAHVEAVAWVASRKDLMSGAFSLASSALMVRGLRLQNSICLLLAAFPLMLACFSKAAGVTQVLFNVLLVASTWRYCAQPSTRRVAVVALVLQLLIALVAVYTHSEVASLTGIRVENSPGIVAMLDRASRIISELTLLIAIPYPLSLYHDIYQLGDWHWMLTGTVGVVFLWGVFRCVRHPSLTAFGVVLILVPLPVYVQIMPFSTWSLASERFIFVSIAGFSLIAMDFVHRARFSRQALAAFLAVAVSFGSIVAHRVSQWEFGSDLYANEKNRHPDFHNVVRDETLFLLLPAQQFEEAIRLSGTIERGYARDAMIAYISFDRRYQEIHGKSEVGGDAVNAWCNAYRVVVDRLAIGFSHIRAEPDITYNNFLRSLDRAVFLSGAQLRCRTGSSW